MDERNDCITRIIILMPLGIYQSIKPEVLAGIQTISLPYTLHIHTSEPTSNRIICITNTRNSLRRVVSKKEYYLLLDSDVILESWVVPLLVDYLHSHPEVGMCAVPTKREWRVTKHNLKCHPHVNLSCALIRGEVLVNIPFRYEGRGCECLLFNKDVRNLGYESHYATSKTIKECK